MEQRIRFATYINEPVYTKHETWTVKRDDRRRIARLFVWLGKRLNVFQTDFERSVEYTSHTIDFVRCTENLFKHQANVEMVSNQRARYLIVGRDQLDKIYFHDMVVRHLGTHQVYLYRQTVTNGRPMVTKFGYDLEVIFVPYIDGAFVLPDICENRC